MISQFILLATVALAADRTPEMPKHIVRSSNTQTLDVAISAIQKKNKAKTDDKEKNHRR